MRPISILSAVFLTAAVPVSAQVTVDLHALQALPDNRDAGRPSAAPLPPSHSQAPHSPASRAQGSRQNTSPPGAAPQAPLLTRTAPATVVPPPAPSAPRPSMPENVPATAAINPVAPPEPPAGSPPAPSPPVSDKAATNAASTPAGLRLTFAPGQSDLSPASTASIKQLTQAAAPGDSTTFNVLAYAPGKPDDPSTARRVSLSRAMAVRSALVADGVPSARIFVRALGEQHGDGPADRVDIGLTGADSPPGTAPAK